MILGSLGGMQPCHHLTSILANEAYVGFLGSGLTFVVIDCSTDKKPHTELSTADLLLNILLANEESDPRAEPLGFFSARFCTGV